MTPRTNPGAPFPGEPLERLFGDAPNLLPRIARIAPAFFARRLRHPVFLIGCGRSGKTIVAEVLGRHPDIALFPGEANHLWYPELYPWRESPHRERVPPIWVDPVAFARGADQIRTRLHTRLLQATFGAYQMLRRRRVFLNESALTSMLVPFILSAFPTARILYMVRDGRAVAPAWARRQYEQIQRYEDPYRAAGLALDFDAVLDRCAASWNRQVLEVSTQFAATGLAGTRRTFLLRYEAFCARPAESIARLTSWLGLEPGPLLRLPLDHIQDRNATDSAELTRTALARIETSMTEGLALHGYLPAAAGRVNG